MRRFAFIILTAICSNLSAQNMNNEALGEAIYALSDTVIGERGRWQFLINDIPLMCITDEAHNRMRIICPIQEIKDVSPEQLQAAMEANFHSALDVRYAVSEGIIWSAFIHPLAQLTRDQVLDAIRQVYNSAVTFGTTYSSTELVFPKSSESESDESPGRID